MQYGLAALNSSANTVD
ncbi:hypothetical protein [Salmonella enterica]